MALPKIGSASTLPKRESNVIPGGARSHFVMNVASNVGYMGLTTIAMTLYIPFLIRHLGVAAYGMVPLANSLILYISTITDGLNVAINRYLTIDLNRSDETIANRTFNTALCISLIAVGILMPFGAVLTWLFPFLFQVPTGLENEVRVLFACVTLTFFLAVLDSNFAVSTMIFHRFDLRNLVRGLTMITRMGTAILLLTLFPANLSYVGWGFVLSAIVSFTGNWWLWRTLTPQLHVRWSMVDRTRLKALLGLSGWAIVNRIGMLLFLSTDLLVVNVLLGAKMTGWYGTLLLFPELLRNIVDTVTSVLSPVIMARYALQDFEGMRHLASRAVKLMSLALALPVGLLCGFARPFLTIWLGPEFQNLDILLIALVGYLSVILATLPLSYVLTSYNKVRIQGIVTLILGIINLALSVILAQWGGWGAIGVAASTAIVFIIRGLFFLSSYSAYVMGLRWWTYYQPLLGGAAGTLGVSLAAYELTRIWWPQSWLSLGSMSIAISLVYSVAAYYLGLSREDRRYLLHLIYEPIRKHIWR